MRDERVQNLCEEHVYQIHIMYLQYFLRWNFILVQWGHMIISVSFNIYYWPGNLISLRDASYYLHLAVATNFAKYAHQFQLLVNSLVLAPFNKEIVRC